MNEIKLKSRYGINNKLVKLDDTDSLKYKLVTEYNYRVGLNDSKEATFIDPAGGPFITVGDNIEGHIVKSISMNGIIEFES